METDITLRYLNEDDRAYGLAGMAISLAALDALDTVTRISLDAEGPMVTFAGHYYFAGSPSVSPKAVWDTLVRNFHITSTMVVGNVMARSLIRMGRDVPEEILTRLREEIAAEGADTCSLEPDETDALFRRTLSYSRRIFANPRIKPAVDEFARVISRRRDLTSAEIRDELSMLNII